SPTPPREIASPQVGVATPANPAPTPGQSVPNPQTAAPAVNPDLVGDIRLILAPVEQKTPEGQVQIQTLGNRYSVTAAGNVRNGALDPNSWNSRATWTPFGSNGFSFALTGIEGRNLRFENSSGGTYSYGCADCAVLVWESGVGTPSASPDPGIVFHLSL